MSGRGDDRESMYGESLEGQLDFLEKENASLKRKLSMQSDLDLQGYEHMRDELQELRGMVPWTTIKEIMKAIRERAEATCQK